MKGTHFLKIYYYQALLSINFKNVRIDFESAEENMKKYGSVLMKQLPEKTTAFLKLLCTEYRPQGEPLVDEKGVAVPAKAAKPGNSKLKYLPSFHVRPQKGYVF